MEPGLLLLHMMCRDLEWGKTWVGKAASTLATHQAAMPLCAKALLNLLLPASQARQPPMILPKSCQHRCFKAI